ncbi:MAG TPA: hypothetical protein VND70_01680 [Acidimicrobiales bacterium]|nr:hypothetical protein [Acidimicrobiales bacterium]
MSMYSELLSVLCADADPLVLPESQDEMVVILLQCRQRLQEKGSGDGRVMAEELALELDHDRMLLRLCSAVGIQGDPELFVNPIAERLRLEELLQKCGVDFRTLADARRVTA